MARDRIVIVGSSFTGLTAALELAKRLNGRHEIVVVANSERGGKKGHFAFWDDGGALGLSRGCSIRKAST